MTDFISQDEVRVAMAQGKNKIGALVYWKGITGVRIERGIFRQGFRVAGLGRAVQRDPLPEAVLHQASMVAKRRQDRDAPKAKVELKAKGTHATYAILARRDLGDQWRYIEEARVAVERSRSGQLLGGYPTPSVEVDPAAPADAQRDALVEEMLQNYTDLCKYAGSEELSSTLTRAMGVARGVPLRGGVYLIPAARLDQVRLLKAFLEQNTTAALTVWDIHASDENAAEAKRGAREAFKERLDELVSEVKAFADANADPEKANAKSVNAHARHFADLDARVMLWVDVLGDHIAELRGSISQAKDSLLGRYLAEVDAEPMGVLDEDEIPAPADDAAA